MSDTDESEEELELEVQQSASPIKPAPTRSGRKRVQTAFFEGFLDTVTTLDVDGVPVDTSDLPDVPDEPTDDPASDNDADESDSASEFPSSSESSSEEDTDPGEETEPESSDNDDESSAGEDPMSDAEPGDDVVNEPNTDLNHEPSTGEDTDPGEETEQELSDNNDEVSAGEDPESDAESGNDAVNEPTIDLIQEPSTGGDPLEADLRFTRVSNPQGKKGVADHNEPPFDYDWAIEDWLTGHGYDAEMLAKGNNMFPKKSTFRIKIDSLIEAAPRLRRKALDIQQRSKKIKTSQLLGSDPNCIPKHLVHEMRPTKVKLTKKIGRAKHMMLTAERLVAIFKPVSQGGLPESEFWKVVAPLDYSTKDTGAALLYNCSARCCVWQGHKHCLCADHVNMETRYENQYLRSAHHRAISGCFHEDGNECLGDSVTRGKWIMQDRVIHLCTKGCGRFKTSDSAYCDECREEEEACSAHCAYKACKQPRKPQGLTRQSTYCINHQIKCYQLGCFNRIAIRKSTGIKYCARHTRPKCAYGPCQSRAYYSKGKKGPVYCWQHPNLCTHPGCTQRGRKINCMKHRERNSANSKRVQ